MQAPTEHIFGFIKKSLRFCLLTDLGNTDLKQPAAGAASGDFEVNGEIEHEI